MTIAQAYKECRRRAGLTQAQLAGLVGVAAPLISQRENGLRAIPIEDLPVLALASGCRVVPAADGWAVEALPDLVGRREGRDATPDVPEDEAGIRVFGEVSAGDGSLPE